MPRAVDPLVRVDPTAALVAQYRRVIADIARRIRLGALRPDSYLASQIPLILKELGRLDIFARRWAERQIPDLYRLGARVAQGELAAAGMASVTTFGGFDAAAVRALVTRTSSNLANVKTALVQGLLGGEKPTSAKAVGLMRDALAGDGRLVNVTGKGLAVRVPSGRYWDASAYAKMEAKTATYDSLRVARRARYLQNGADVVVVTSTGTDHAVCAAWEGERLSLTGATPGLPTPEDARADGLWHPNCEHSYIIDSEADQPGGDLTAEPETYFPTLGELPPTVRESATSRIRRKIAETLASS